MRRIVVVAAEESASLHALHLLKELKKLGDYSFIGTGSPFLAEEMKLIATASELNLVGMEEPKKLIRILRIYQKLKQLTRESYGTLLIDYPGINLRLACYAKKHQKPVCYYVAPQTWAWASWRNRKIARCVDALTCRFPFEEKYFKRHNVNARFFGHPLVERLEGFCAQERRYLVLMPGSRDSEVKQLLPVMVESVTKLIKKHHLKPVLITTPSVRPELYEAVPNWIERVDFANRYEIMGKGVVALAASGTATLELAILEVPTIVLYKASPVSWRVGEKLVKVNFLSIVNILLNREVFPELLQERCTAKEVERSLQRLVESETLRQNVMLAIRGLKEKLRGSNCYRKAAEFFHENLSKTS